MDDGGFRTLSEGPNAIYSNQLNSFNLLARKAIPDIIHSDLNIQIAYPPVEGKVPAKKKAAKKAKKK